VKECWLEADGEQKVPGDHQDRGGEIRDRNGRDASPDDRQCDRGSSRPDQIH
jgi:hypothetical protein